ncbi:DUF6702 family protein [Brumimicrobium aurantiacum]|uniref:Peptidase E n=1 Tax=Brumimicrobium aurantiacum TaxID=1737063 RepID=A0A3E1F0R5_9FLAO|nr:DUF6702 family protein [Brumimicrobium aurantiacum]RFC55404.1 hypothetical protein DXU93_00265 [Brumimicrobium aurantiacum]
MKLKLFFLSFIFLLAFQSQAHEFYFSFAEMQYNDSAKKFEISLEVTGHDFEAYLKDKEINIPKLEDCKDNPIYLNIIQNEIKEGFKILVEDREITLNIVGMDINDNDQVVFFLTSSKIEKPENIDIQYNLLMDFFPLQQNKLTLFTPEGKKFVTFINTRFNRTVAL